MHWPVYGHTVAELIYLRANAEQPNMGVSNYSGKFYEINRKINPENMTYNVVNSFGKLSKLWWLKVF